MRLAQHSPGPRLIKHLSYDEEPAPTAAAPASKAEPGPAAPGPASASAPDTMHNGGHEAVVAASSWQPAPAAADNTSTDHSGYAGGDHQSYDNAPMADDDYGPINVKEDG